MKTKFLLTLTLIASIQGQAQSNTYTNLYIPGKQRGTPKVSLVVQTNQIARVVGYYFKNDGRIDITIGGDTFSHPAPTDLSAYPKCAGPGLASYSYPTFSPVPIPAPLVGGPATITLVSYSQIAATTNVDTAAFCTIELITPSSPNGISTPSTAVVIPSDSGGPVNIILESSVDLVNWTPALPGTYGTTTSNRFFRVRAVRVQ